MKSKTKKKATTSAIFSVEEDEAVAAATADATTAMGLTKPPSHPPFAPTIAGEMKQSSIFSGESPPKHPHSHSRIEDGGRGWKGCPPYFPFPPVFPPNQTRDFASFPPLFPPPLSFPPLFDPTKHRLKGIQYEFVEEDLTNKSPLFVNYNPVHKRVPVLVHHGNPIAESLVIIEYIDDTWKQNPIMPQDPYERARARFWAKFVEEKFTEVIRGTIMLEGEQQEKEVKQAREALDVLEGELKGKKFFGGDTIGFLDIVMGWIAIWLGVIEEIACIKVFDSNKYPFIGKWMENFAELPVVKENLPARDKLVLYFHKIRQFGLASAVKK